MIPPYYDFCHIVSKCQKLKQRSSRIELFIPDEVCVTLMIKSLFILLSLTLTLGLSGIPTRTIVE